MIFDKLFKKNSSKETAASENKTETGRSTKGVIIGEETGNSVSGDELIQMFAKQYAPYTIKDYVIKERTYDEIPPLDESRPMLRSMAHQVDLKRSQDPMVGAKIASQEIYINIINMLKDDKGVHAETLLAVLASVCGRLCVQGIMNTLSNMISGSDPERKKLLYATATILQIMIVETKNGDTYVMGDRIGNEFLLCYSNAIAQQGDIQKLIPVARKTSECVGTEDYWKTPFDDLVRHSPRELADRFTGVFEITYKTYCRFPQERMLAVAFAAQKAINELVVNQHVIDKEKAASIISEYGWRTSHYWGKL